MTALLNIPGPQTLITIGPLLFSASYSTTALISYCPLVTIEFQSMRNVNSSRLSSLSNDQGSVYSRQHAAVHTVRVRSLQVRSLVVAVDDKAAGAGGARFPPLEQIFLVSLEIDPNSYDLAKTPHYHNLPKSPHDEHDILHRTGRGGMTHKPYTLALKVQQSDNNFRTLYGAMEGPYGKHHSLTYTERFFFRWRCGNHTSTLLSSLPHFRI